MLSPQSNIKTVMDYINSDREAGLYLPNIQRSFVWDEDRILKFLDSVVRNYPIPTILIWGTEHKIHQRPFIRNFEKDQDYRKFNLPSSSKKRTYLVLDGQQRLQSLYISLYGSFNSKRVYINLKKQCEDAALEYEFKFIHPEDVKGLEGYWVELEEIVSESSRKIHGDKYADRFEVTDEKERSSIRNIVQSVTYAFGGMVPAIPIRFLDDDYSYEEIAEIFIRYNSGGKELGKADLLFALGIVKWEEMGERVSKLLSDINETGYKLKKDFILKAVIFGFGLGAEYSIDVFRKDANIEAVKERWDEFCDALRAIFDFLKSRTVFKHAKNLRAPNRLLPIIYFRFQFKKKWEEMMQDEEYLSMLITTYVLTGLNQDDDDLIPIRNIISQNQSIHPEIFSEYMKEKRRCFKSSAEEIVATTFYQKTGYEDFLILSIMDRDVGPWASYRGNALQKDHLFPDRLLRSDRQYKDSDINQLANLTLLRQTVNRQKGSKDIHTWLSEQTPDFLEKHLIPSDRNLWKTENFKHFIEERKKLIIQRLDKYFLKFNQRLFDGVVEPSRPMDSPRPKRYKTFRSPYDADFGAFLIENICRWDDEEIVKFLKQYSPNYPWKGFHCRNALMRAAQKGAIVPWEAVHMRVIPTDKEKETVFRLYESGIDKPSAIKNQMPQSKLNYDQIYWLMIKKESIEAEIIQNTIENAEHLDILEPVTEIF